MAFPRRKTEERRPSRLRLVPCAEGKIIEGRAVRLTSKGGVDVRLPGRAALEARLPQHVSPTWLRTALAVGPIDVVIALFPPARAIVWCVLPSAEQAMVATDVTTSASRVQIEAAEGLELRCGKSTLSMEPDGKVQLRGKEILSRASGLHRIKGGAVRIN